MLFLLSILILGSCVSALIIKQAYGKLDILEPLIPAVIAMVSLFSVRPLAMLAAGETGSYRWFNIQDSITLALAICSLGVMSYLAGYFLFSRAPVPKSGRSQIFFSKKRLHAVAAFYIIASLFLTAAYLGSNPIATLAVLSRGRSDVIGEYITVHSEYLFVAPLLLSCAATLIILGNEKWTISIQKRLILFILIATPLAYFYLVGTRRFMLPALLVPSVAYLLKSGKRPRARHIALGIPFFLIFAAIPFMRTEGAREQIGGFGDQISFAFTRSGIWKDIFLGPDTEMLPAFAVEVKVLDDYNKFFYGRAVFGDLAFAPIPSALFPKPVSARDQMLIEAFGSRCSANPGALCPDFSIIGTFYQDFWIPGVMLGMMISGIFSRKVWLGYRVQPDNPFRICSATVTTVFTLIIMRAGFMPAFQWSLYFFIPITVGLYLSRKKEVRYAHRRDIGRTTARKPLAARVSPFIRNT
jgi:hypothetical protein